MSEITGALRGIPVPEDRWKDRLNELGVLESLVVRSNLVGSDRTLAN